MGTAKCAKGWCVVGLACVFLTIPVYSQERNAGSLRGVVINLADGNFVPKASVGLAQGDLSVVTDMDGNFALELPPGKYDLVVSADGFVEQRVTGIEVTAGETTFQDIPLNPQGLNLGEVTVVADAERASAAALLAERKSAAIVLDSISRQEIAKTTGSSAADAMQRVTGVSIVENKYVYIRGLGERYSNTMLNGSIVPSTQPDKKVVGMDLFPSALLQSIRTEKSYTPDQPGEFSGGLVKIDTTDFPTQPTMKISVSQGFGTNTTFKDDFLNYPGGDWDWLGFDDGTRSLPGAIPSQRLVRQTRFSSAGFTPEQMESFGESFANVWETGTQTAPPNQTLYIVGGNTFGRLGLVLALSHSNKFHSQSEEQTIYRVGSGSSISPFHDYDFQISRRSIRTGAIANLAYEVTADHRFQFRNFYTQDTTNEARFFEGFNGDARNEVRDTRLRFTEEGIYSGQLASQHYLPVLGNSLLEWRLTYSNSTMEEPDLRETLYEFNPARGEFVLADESQSGFRQFSRLGEDLWEPALDWTTFFLSGSVNGSFKVGGSYRTRQRDFSARRFRFVPRGTQGIDMSLPPERIFAPENIRRDGFEVREETRPTDTYEALEITRAGYAMVDVTLGRWRFEGGARVEGNTQTVLTFDLFDRNSPASITSELAKTDILPSAALIYRLQPNMNLRASFSKTLNRPEFRELAPFEFTDVVGGRSVVGNPSLQRALIQNYDVRWEWFLSAEEMFSLSFFHKNFDDPIERVVEPTAQLRTSFVNADSARNLGLEVEVRKSLGFVSGALEAFNLLANYTFVDSEIEIGQQQLVVLTSLKRPLAGQSRHVLNTILEFAPPGRGSLARLLLNFQGDRITDVGSFGLPDIIQEGEPRIDALFTQRLGEGSPWVLKVTAENLLNQAYEFSQGGEPMRRFSTGRTFSIGVSYSFFGER